MDLSDLLKSDVKSRVESKVWSIDVDRVFNEKC